MASIAVLSKEKHKNLRVKPNPDLVHMKNQNVVTVSIKEMSRATNNFPVVFIKHPETGELRLVAVLGFQAGENVFYDKVLWKCSYAPLVMLRYPFIIGPDESGDRKRLTTCLEEDSEFLSETEGTALFNEDGSETDFLKHHQQLMAEIFDGEVRTHKFVERMVQLELIKGFNVTIQTTSGKLNRYTGLLTIDEEKLKALDKEQVSELHSNGYLPVIYLMLGSLGQLHQLVKLKNMVDKEDPIVGLQIGPEGQEAAA